MTSIWAANEIKKILIVLLIATIVKSIVIMQKSAYLLPRTADDFTTWCVANLFDSYSGMLTPDFSCIRAAPWRKKFD
jgi:hypothetical protein